MSSKETNESIETEEKIIDESSANADDSQSPVDGQPVERPDLDREDLPKLFEVLLFAAGHPLTLDKLCEVSKAKDEDAVAALDTLKHNLSERAAPIELVEVNGGYQLRTKDFFAPFVQELKRTRPRRLSAAALETLAIVAYRQPVVKSDIEAIRGVDVTPTLKTLLDRKLIRIIGYQATVGQPALYGTTEAFLELFGLNSVADLPALRDLRELSEDPGEDPAEAASEDLSEADIDESPDQTQAEPLKAANE